MNTKKILVIEDEEPLRDSLVRMLGLEGYAAEGAPNGEAGLASVMQSPPDAILCDILMPVMDGNVFASILRSEPATQHIPLVMITALSDRASQRSLMEIGADDFLVKPFTHDELLGTLRAQFKKYEILQNRKGDWQRPLRNAPMAAHAAPEFGGWSYEPVARRLRHLTGKTVWLTAAEGRLLNMLIQHAGKPVTREALHTGLNGEDFLPTDRSIDILVARLRRKLGDDSRNPSLIRTIRNVGYMLEG